ncbi:Membrane-associated kinase regulator 6 [Heracleum sosnowskyi]|uniref:Membrane-associated kinase regulator 6 n=1 Tax=Heracleum sosnowskyi TaxID=360622 RepID=A0AAD8HCK3_9APIA|nr:Membrane-associated kinase regulator 6 [Heracleum sosnowskyi]
MATHLFSGETPPVTSPRISFSHNLSQSDINQQRLLSLPVSSSVDFDFCIRQSNVDQSSSAEDLFSDGKILPIDPNLKHEPPLPPPQPLVNHAAKCDQDSNETVVSVLSESHDQKQKSVKSSFWQFKRSSSLNCGSVYVPTLCPIPLLSRSHSTGSASSPNKLSSSPREFQPNHKQHAQKKNSVPVVPIKQSKSSPSNGHQKIPLKKSGSMNGNGNGSGVGVNPLINVSSANLFGLGSIFSGNKEKNKKK